MYKFHKLNCIFSLDISCSCGIVRVCLVEARGTYKKAPVNCPILEAKSNIECVIGLDRLDCMRRISKGTAHFGVFSPEELIAAKWFGANVLVTSELRFNDGKLHLNSSKTQLLNKCHSSVNVIYILLRSFPV